jgi:hypothetical protein
MALPAPDWFQQIIVDFLKTNIEVKDDSDVVIPGVVSGDWYNKDVFSDGGWQVSVGPENLQSGRIADIGAENKEYNAVLYINVWVQQKRTDEIDYTPERIRSELLHQIDTILWQVEMGRSQDFRMDLSDWSPLDEPENKILRSQARLKLWYMKNRGGSVIT